MKILVFEDDSTSADYLAVGLREEGHSVDMAANGSEGLVKASVAAYDVAIVDRMLPGLNGMSLVKTLRGARTERRFCSSRRSVGCTTGSKG